MRLIILLALNLGWVNPLPSLLGSKICMTDLGCFELTTDFFHPLYRLFNYLPEDRSLIDTRFQLYSRRFPREYRLLNSGSLEEMDASLPTVFIIHGFRNNITIDKWMNNMKDEFLLRGDYNVVLVDWCKGAKAPYSQATANTRVVGAEIAFLIKTLEKNKDLDPMNVHVIGHSLGAQIAGYAGQRLKKLGRITGLDPAAPYFEHMPPSVRLDRTDADFVDVIHTDSVAFLRLALGFLQPCGHVDFYPNHGRDQPGCAKETYEQIIVQGFIDGQIPSYVCSHERVTDYFKYSLNYKRVQPVGVECTSWQDYVDGKCSDCRGGKCAVMGIDADSFKPYKNDSRSVKMYLTTSGEQPYWEVTYHISVKLKKKVLHDKRGSIKLSIIGSQNRHDLTMESRILRHGEIHTHLVHLQEPLGDIQNVTFMWKSTGFNIIFKPSIHLEYVVVKPINSIDDKVQEEQSRKFCSIYSPLESEVAMELEPC